MHDCVSANLASYRDSLRMPFPFSDDNGCLPHTGAHVGEAMATPTLDEFMLLYNAAVGQSNKAIVFFKQITGYVAKRKSATRWFSTSDVQELSLLPNLANGKLLAWTDKLIAAGICDKTAPKLRAMLLNPTKSKIMALELTAVVSVAVPLKARVTSLEGDEFTYVTGYDTVVHMGEALRNPMTPELRDALKQLAISNGAEPSLFGAENATAAPAAPQVTSSILETLLSLPLATLKTVNVSIDSCFWKWDQGDAAPQPRFSGKPTSWASQEKGKEELRIKFEIGRDADGNAQEGYVASKAFTMASLLDPRCGFRLDPFDDGTAPPVLHVQPTAPVCLLSSTDFTRLDVLIARAEAVVSPAVEYFRNSMEGKRGDQLARMKACRFFNPLFAMGAKVTETDIDGLSCFTFSEHPRLKPDIAKMKTELVSYNALVLAIKPLPERKDKKGNDTFNIGDWWRANENQIPAFAKVLRAVLTNAPNSIPPERVFSILNNTFDDDQGSSKADYKELSLQLQFNARSRIEVAK